MRLLLDKYALKLVAAGLADPGAPLLGGLDAGLEWNREDPAEAVLEQVVKGMGINSILFSRPAEPYRTIIDHLSMNGSGPIRPRDSETRTFLHDLPVVTAFESGPLLDVLRTRKSAIVPERGIVTWGTVSPEQAFIFFSSVCFACFVKFFSDLLEERRAGRLSHGSREVLGRVLEHIPPCPDTVPTLMRAPFRSEEEVYAAVAEAGLLTVEKRLVDSFFGNVSLKWRDTLYISQTTSSLDELEGCIVPCRLDGSSCLGITASSELTAHIETLSRSGADAVLHGHPRFSVIMSMDCTEDCRDRGRCHTSCSRRRTVCGVPVVPGEVGTGPTGLCNTLPEAMEHSDAVLVWGHGLFTTSRRDLNGAFSRLMSVEGECRELCLELLRG